MIKDYPTIDGVPQGIELAYNVTPQCIAAILEKY